MRTNSSFALSASAGSGPSGAGSSPSALPPLVEAPDAVFARAISPTVVFVRVELLGLDQPPLGFALRALFLAD